MSDSTTPQPPHDQAASEEQGRPVSLWRRIWRWTRAGLLFLFLILLIFQIPAVQNWLAQRVVQSLEKTLETKVSLDRARLVFFDELSLDNLLVEDVYGDTLLASGLVKADFNLNPLVIIQRGLEIEAVSISGARFNIRRAPGDLDNNLKVAIQKLFPKDPQDSLKTKNPLSIGLKELRLLDVEFTQNDSINGAGLSIYLEDGQAWINQLDIPSQSVDVNTIRLSGPVVRGNELQWATLTGGYSPTGLTYSTSSRLHLSASAGWRISPR